MEDKWLEQLKEGKCISERDVKILCDKLKEILCEELFYYYTKRKT